LELFSLPLNRRILVLRALSALGCLVFLFSITSPFLFARYPNSIVPEDVNMTKFWSFKSNTEQGNPFLRVAPKIYENWFFDYWIKESAYRSEFLALFPLMFVAQLLTLTTGVASILARKGFLFYAPVVFCLIVIALMAYLSMTAKINWSWQYQEGFWLTSLSLFLFLAVFILEHRQGKNANIHNLSKNLDTMSNTK
jgi:hypothetical protein